MASTINSDSGVISGSSGVKTTADASGVLALQTNGTTAVTVDTSQRVGIGTTSPSYNLDVNGVIAVGTGSNRGFFYNDGSKILLENNSTTYPLAFSVNGAVRAAINSSGALGFGSSPSYGTSGQVLTSGGSGAAPSWTTLTVSGSGGTTASGSVTLTSASSGAQSVTPTDYGQYVKLPDATTMTKAACVFTINNKGTYPIKILNNSGSVLGFLYPGDTSIVGLSDSSTAAGVWDCSNLDILAVTARQVQTISTTLTFCDQIELDSNRTFILLSSSTAMYGQVFDASTATWGTLTSIRTGNTASSGRAWLVTTDKILVVSDISTAREAVALTFSGTTITVNTAATATITSATNTARFTVGTTFILTQVAFITAFTVSGTTVTVGTQTAVVSGTASYAIGFQVSASSGLVITGTNANSVKYYAFTVSGTTITLGTVGSIAGTTNVSISSSGLKAAAIGSQWVAVYQSSAANQPFGATIFSVSGTTVTVSSTTNLVTAFDSSGLFNLYVTGNKCAVWVSTTNWIGLNIITNTAGTLSIGTAWTSNIGSIGNPFLAFASGTTAMFTAKVNSTLFVYSADLSGSSPSVTYKGQFFGVGTTANTPSISTFNRVLQGSIGVGINTNTSSSSFTPLAVVNTTKYYASPSKIYSTFVPTDFGSMTIPQSMDGTLVWGTAFWGSTQTNYATEVIKIETIT